MYSITGLEYNNSLGVPVFVESNTVEVLKRIKESPKELTNFQIRRSVPKKKNVFFISQTLIATTWFEAHIIKRLI